MLLMIQIQRRRWFIQKQPAWRRFRLPQLDQHASTQDAQLLADTLARTLVAPAEMPVGLITSIIGGPYFLWLILRPGVPRNV